jgi:hypothetical protein
MSLLKSLLFVSIALLINEDMLFGATLTQPLSEFLVYTDHPVVSRECHTSTIEEQNKCIENACLKFNCKNGTIENFCENRRNQYLYEMDCIAALIQKYCSAVDYESIKTIFEKNEVEVEVDECKVMHWQH